MKSRNNYNDDIYNKNIETYALYDPVTAYALDHQEFPEYEFCYSHLGELNLKKSSEQKILYFHDMDGIHNEIKQWFHSVDFSQLNKVFLFGLGLGYYYEAAKNWLKSHPNNFLFILEDDQGVLKKFLETELASEILSDQQVIIQFLNCSNPRKLNYSISKTLLPIVKGYLRKEIYLSTSKCYSKLKNYTALVIRDVLFNMISWNLVRAHELVNAEKKIFGNFYTDSLKQYRSYDGNVLKNAFKNIPAIICAAGPSIVKEIEHLKSIQGRALIIASGTGMNVLNYYGIIPNFGTGLDPTDAQKTRILTNYAYEVPYFYRTRFNHESFDILHGPKLLLAGNSGYSISNWFTEHFNIDASLVKEFVSGISSTNFSLEFARHIGCNPIILLGCDLSYTDASRYPPIISAHPTDSRGSKMEIDQKAETLLLGKGNAGQQVLTKMDWIEEAKAIYQYQARNPHLHIFNATSEGLHIQDVNYVPFSEIIKNDLQHSFDIRNAIHAQIQESNIVNTKEKGLEVYQEWKESLQKSLDLCNELEEEIKSIWEKVNQGYSLPDPPYSGRIALLEEDLKTEAAYTYYLQDFIEIIEAIAIPQKIHYRRFVETFSEEEKHIKRLEIDFNYIVFYKKHLTLQLQLQETIYQKFLEEERQLAQSYPQNIHQTETDDLYSIENNRLRISDKELDLDINIPFDPIMLQEDNQKMQSENEILTDLYLTANNQYEGQYLKFHDDGSIHCEMFFHEGQLHGPVTYFASSGQVLSTSWFIQGLQQGKNLQYYLSGELYSRQRYKENLWEGIQEYYYKDGTLKSIITYSKGILNGKVELYYPNGAKKRELFFHEGKLHGEEKYWYPNGTLYLEAMYTHGLPSGKASVFSSQGKLLREYTYFDDHKHYNLKEWNANGDLIHEEVNITEDLKETAQKKAEKIFEAMSSLDRDLNTIKIMTKNEKKHIIH